MMLARGDSVIVCCGLSSSLPGSIMEEIRSVGLRPVVYQGIGLDTRRSNLDNELRDDFFAAKFRIVFIDSSVDTPASDSWALPELKHVPSNALLVYVTDNVSPQEVDQLALPVKPIRVANGAAFLGDLLVRLGDLLRVG